MYKTIIDRDYVVTPHTVINYYFGYDNDRYKVIVRECGRYLSAGTGCGTSGCGTSTYTTYAPDRIVVAITHDYNEADSIKKERGELLRDTLIKMGVSYDDATRATRWWFR